MNDSAEKWKQERASADEAQRPADPTASLRSFSQNVGFLMQGLGASMFMLTTCVCCGIAFREGDALHSGFIDTSSAAGNEAAPLLLITNVLGSLALVAFGLGQQSDRGRAPAIGTAATTTAMVLLYGVVAVIAESGTDAPGGGWPFIVGVVLALLMLLCSLLTWAAASQVLRNPPLSSEPPTVPADAFPDPLARPREKYDSPAEGDIAKRRKRLEDEMRDLEALEQRVREQNRSLD